jgi:hypothetical protein
VIQLESSFDSTTWPFALNKTGDKPTPELLAQSLKDG